MIVDAAQHIPRDEPVSHVDARILHCADRLGTVLGESEPTTPTPFDRRIEEALAAEAEKREEWEAADEERIERARHVDRALVAAQASQEAFERVEEDFTRALAAKNELEHAHSRWRAVARLSQ